MKSISEKKIKPEFLKITFGFSTNGKVLESVK